MKQNIKNHSFGQVLSQNRLNKNWSIQELSQESLVKQEYIKKLENNETDFIEEPYIRSMLTTLSNYLEIDKKQILDLYNRSIQKKEKEPKSPPPPPKKKKRWLFFIPILLLIMLLFLIELYKKETIFFNINTPFQKTKKVEKIVIKNKLNTIIQKQTKKPSETKKRKIVPPLKRLQLIQIICKTDSSWLTIYRPNLNLLSQKLTLNDTITIFFNDSLQAISGVKQAFSVIYNNKEYGISKFFSIRNQKLSHFYNYR